MKVFGSPKDEKLKKSQRSWDTHNNLTTLGNPYLYYCYHPRINLLTVVSARLEQSLEALAQLPALSRRARHWNDKLPRCFWRP